MTDKKLILVTSAGNFVLPPAYKVATLKGSTINYEFVPELAKGMQVLVRKDIADVNLEEDIKPTLWARSEQYRSDRTMLFNGSGHGMPDQAKLSTFIKDSLVGKGIAHNHDSEAADSILTLIKPNFNYSITAALSWVSGRTMFPNDPQVALYLAHQLHNKEMIQWISQMLENDLLEVRRLRTVHRAIMAAVGAPKQREFATINNSKSGPTQRIIQISPYLQAIKQEYGNDIFQEFVTNARILDIREINESHQVRYTSPIATPGNSVQPATEEQVKLTREIVGFTNYDSNKRRETLGRYHGHDNSKEIEIALINRNEVITRAIPKIFKAATNHYNLFTREEISKEAVGLGGLIISSLQLFNPHRSLEHHFIILDETLKLFNLFSTNINVNTKVRNLINQPIKDFLEGSKNYPYFRVLYGENGLLRRIYHKSIVEKYQLSYPDFVSLMLSKPGATIENDLKKLASVSISERRDVLQIYRERYNSQKEFLKVVSNEVSIERKEAFEISNQLYPSILVLQDELPEESAPKQMHHISKLLRSYGISSFYPILSSVPDEIVTLLRNS